MVLQKATVIQIHCIYVLQTDDYLLSETTSNTGFLIGGELPRSNFMFNQPRFSSLVPAF